MNCLKTYRVGIIGMGRMGEIRRRELESHDKFEIVAVTDFNPEVEKKYPKISKSSWKEVLSSNLDCVFVCTYNDVIPEIVCEALDMGLHVFSEKPPGKSLKCVKQMEAALKRSRGKVLKFGFNHRFHHSVMKTKEVLESGEFGKILWARGSYGKAGEEGFEKIWRSNLRQAGGGILMDQGIHMVDLLIHFMGDFTDIKSMVETQYWDIPMEDNAHAIMKSQSGAVAMLHSSSTHWKNYFSLELGLERGILHLDGILSNSRSYAPEKLRISKRIQNSGRPETEEWTFDIDDSWKLEIEDFYQGIENEEKLKYGTISDAIKVMETIEGIYENSKLVSSKKPFDTK